MSVCTMPIEAAKIAVSAPITAPAVSGLGALLKMALEGAVMKMPAVTIVAAWINAETGVGPSIASGSQTYKGICADLPVAPIIRHSAMAVITPAPAVSMGYCAARARTVV